MKYSFLVDGLVATWLVSAVGSAGSAPAVWPQFRGLNGSGIAPDDNPPVHFNLQSNLVWQATVPSGASSPCIWGDRVFLTAFDQGKLETLCLRRADGEVLWRRAAPAETIEAFEPREGSPAAATPLADGSRVYAYFGSCGLICYDFAGGEQWRRMLPPLKSFGGFGSGASPVLVDGLVILNRDQVGGSQLVAVRASDGEVAWTTERGLSYGWSTPAIWEHDGLKEIVLPASAVLKSYDVKTGAERWSVRGIAAATCSTPVTGEGLLFVSSWSNTEASNAPPPFNTMVQQLDKDHDEGLSAEEVAGSPLAPVFQALDLNRDRRVTPEEYEPLRALAARSRNVLLAVRPGGTGDITDSHVAWTQNKGLPYVSSPLYYEGRLYVVKDGGLVSCFEARTGQPLYLQERLGAPGNYYASPVAANGRVYAASVSGTVVVFEAGTPLKVLARNELGERISATPAVVEDTLYVRTDQHVFAFGHQFSPAADGVDEVALFDGRSLKGWKDSGFTGSGKIQVEEGRIRLGLGYMTGITWTNENELARMDYEISLEAMRVEGSDFFCGLTFPVGTNSCSLIVGGWGGSVVGLSSLDYADAANNETTQFLSFQTGRWYHIRLRVEPERLQAWIDDRRVVDVNTAGRKISIRSECQPSVPLGVATWSTAAALRNIKLRRF